MSELILAQVQVEPTLQQIWLQKGMHNSELPPLSLQNSAGRKRLTTVQTVIQEARASIHNPSRPFTPREKERKLFTESEYTVRPTSAYSLNSSNFDARLTPILKKVTCYCQIE